MTGNPPRGYISVAQVSRLLGKEDWPTHRVRRWLTREGALVRKGRYLYTTRSKLRRAFRDVFDEMFLQSF